MEKLQIKFFKRKDNAWAARIVHWNGNILCTTHKKFETRYACGKMLDIFLTTCKYGRKLEFEIGFFGGQCKYESEFFIQKGEKYDFRIILSGWGPDASLKKEVIIFSSSQGYESKQEAVDTVKKLFQMLEKGSYEIH